MTFRRKVTIVLVLASSGLILGVGGLTYPPMAREQFEVVRQIARGIAVTGSLTIGGDLHQTIPADPSALNLPAYQELQQGLRKILGSNPGVRFAWTMVKSDRPGETIFVGDVGDARPSPGLRYDASQIPKLWEGFEGPASDRSPVQDPWGTSISGYAPIRNSAGKTVAVLGVDFYGRQLYRFREQFQRLIAIGLVVGIFFSILMGSLIARWIALPVDHLVAGMRRVEGGELTYEVALKTGDEFEEASNAFNRMTRSVLKAREDLKAAFLKTIHSLVSALEAKDPYTRGHSISVTRYAIEIARAMGKSVKEIETIEKLSVLHDIGKIGIHDAVLQKPGGFTDEERKAMQEHPAIGGRILAPLGLTEEEISLITYHHEREDGGGYPHGVDRSKIPDSVAIITVADAYDAMTSHRPYRAAMKPDKAVEELRKNAGSQFRPQVVEALIRVLREKGLAAG
ncbi:MAG: HD domain-containing protein [Candidatus Omnitrophica bacterium]|nr:HD domain-containing protein [Candidatus Omnitrophota bacterium]